MRIPRGVRQEMDEWDEVNGFLYQSRISPKNLKRLDTLTEEGGSDRVRELAGMVAEVGRIAEGRRNRWKHVRRRNPDLIDRLARGFPDLACEVGLWTNEEYDEWVRLSQEDEEEFERQASLQFGEEEEDDGSYCNRRQDELDEGVPF